MKEKKEGNLCRSVGDLVMGASDDMFLKENEGSDPSGLLVRREANGFLPSLSSNCFQYITLIGHCWKWKSNSLKGISAVSGSLDHGCASPLRLGR